MTDPKQLGEAAADAINAATARLDITALGVMPTCRDMIELLKWAYPDGLPDTDTS